MTTITKQQIRRVEILEAKFAKAGLLQFPVPLAVARGMRAARETLVELRNRETGERVSTAAELEEHRARGDKLSPAELDIRRSCEDRIREGAKEIHRAEGYRYGLEEAMRDKGDLAGLGVLRRRFLRGGPPMTKGQDILHMILTARELACEQTPAVLALRKADQEERAF